MQATGGYTILEKEIPKEIQTAFGIVLRDTAKTSVQVGVVVSSLEFKKGERVLFLDHESYGFFFSGKDFVVIKNDYIAAKI